MAIVSAVMVPHPPLAVPEVGRGNERGISATLDSMRRAFASLVESEPDSVVVLSPHSVAYGDYFHISPGSGASGNLSGFGAGEVSFEISYDEDLVSVIELKAEEAGVNAGTLGERTAALDHATMVPLYFLREACGGGLPFDFVRIGLSGLPLSDHYRLGQVIKDSAASLDRRVAIIASGDLSHVLKEDGPYGFRPEGPEYDAKVMDVMGRAAFGELFDFNADFLDAAAVCGHSSFMIMAGALDGTAVKAERLSYEGPFGVGYGVCLYTPDGDDPSRMFLDDYLKRSAAELAAERGSEDEYVALARAAIEEYVLTGGVLPVPEETSRELLNSKAGVFVSLKKEGALRGCIGTIRPETSSVANEIIRNAISSATYDPRFEPVRPEELQLLSVSVDVLMEPEYVESMDELDAKRYGVIVTSGGKRGLLLPNLDGVNTPEEQIMIAMRKAGIADGSAAEIQRFEVIRHI
jgi:AmmeMemoRadiSam system protein A/AmmeMemoRadiSam system protein B